MSDCFFDGESKNELQNESSSADCAPVFCADWSVPPFCSSFAGVDQIELVHEPREGVVPVGGSGSGPLIPSSTCIPGMEMHIHPVQPPIAHNVAT